jgi:nitroreductase
MSQNEQPSRTAFGVHTLLAGRYSPRAFSARDVTEEELELVLEAARLAPSSMNEQPWRFLVARRGGEGHAELLASLMESNRIWADKAPVLILNMAVMNLARNGHPNHHARHDLGLAIAQLTIQASALGMGLHQLGGFHPEQAREVFGIPDDHDLVSVIALGFPGDPNALPENLRQRELARSPRKPLAELVWHGRVKG